MPTEQHVGKMYLHAMFFDQKRGTIFEEVAVTLKIMMTFELVSALDVTKPFFLRR
jgi:hypothetical protein